MRRNAPRDDRWHRIENIPSGLKGSAGVTAADNRLLVESVLFHPRAGIPWHDVMAARATWISWMRS